MDEAVRALVRVSAAVGPFGAADLREALREAAELADPARVEEVLLQSYLFAGYPAALNAIKVWRDVYDGERPEPTPDRPKQWKTRGEEVCRRVYGGQYDRLRENVAALHPDMERWMVVEGYGKVLGRSGLPLEVRELCIVALLVGLNAEPQLFSHLRGALNAGASPEDVEAALREAGRVVPAERRSAALDVWKRVRERRTDSRGS